MLVDTSVGWTMHRLLVTAIAVLLAGSGHAQEAKGDWWGTLPAGAGASIRVVIHVAGEPGKLVGTLDSPDQNTAGIALADVSVTQGLLSFSVPSISGGFVGRWDPGSRSWQGQWRQANNATPLELKGGPLPPAAAPPPPLHADWTIPADPAVAALLDRRIAGRTGEGIVVGLLDGDRAHVVARGPAGAKPFDGRTLFEIGSMSKLFTALVLADMANKGEVSLDDPAAKYLPPGATMPARGGRQITLRDLATHTSGLPRLPDNFVSADPEDPYADYDERLLLAFLAGYQLPREIGAAYEYSNLGMGLLGYLLGRAAGEDYATLVAERITRPLGMADTVIALSPDQRARFAQGHDGFMRPAKPWTLTVLAGAGAIRSTADDMLRFARAAIDPGSPIAAMMKTAVADPRPMGTPNASIGLAWMLVRPGAGHELLFHDGGTGGFRSALLVEPSKRRAVVVLTNAAVEPGSDDLAMHLMIGSPVQPAGTVPPPPPPTKHRIAVAVTPAQLDRVAGRYAVTPAITLTITRDGDGLKAALTGQPPFPIFAEAPLEYFWRVVDAQVRFVADASGAITEAIMTQGGQTFRAKRLP